MIFEKRTTQTQLPVKWVTWGSKKSTVQAAGTLLCTSATQSNVHAFLHCRQRRLLFLITSEWSAGFVSLSCCVLLLQIYMPFFLSFFLSLSFSFFPVAFHLSRFEEIIAINKSICCPNPKLHPLGPHDHKPKWGGLHSHPWGTVMPEEFFEL